MLECFLTKIKSDQRSRCGEFFKLLGPSSTTTLCRDAGATMPRYSRDAVAGRVPIAHADTNLYTVAMQHRYNPHPVFPSPDVIDAIAMLTRIATVGYAFVAIQYRVNATVSLPSRVANAASALHTRCRIATARLSFFRCYPIQ